MPKLSDELFIEIRTALEQAHSELAFERSPTAEDIATLNDKLSKMLTDEQYFSGRYCQCTPCHHLATVMICDGHTGVASCEACAEKRAASGWYRSIELSPTR